MVCQHLWVKNGNTCEKVSLSSQTGCWCGERGVVHRKLTERKGDKDNFFLTCSIGVLTGGKCKAAQTRKCSRQALPVCGPRRTIYKKCADMAIKVPVRKLFSRGTPVAAITRSVVGEKGVKSLPPLRSKRRSKSTLTCPNENLNDYCTTEREAAAATAPIFKLGVA